MIWTQRLVLRRWRIEDRGPLAAMNADPAVMAFQPQPQPLGRVESYAMADECLHALERDGRGLWAVEVQKTGRFVGFAGLTPVGSTGRSAQLSWRIASSSGNHGYAGEAARICLTLAFDSYDLTEVVSAAPLADTKTQRVLQRIGMTRDPADDFDHPGFGPGHPLERHVLYRAGRKH